MLQGERRVKNNLGELVRSFGSARSGSDLVGAAVFHLGESLKIGLGAAVGLSAGYAAYSILQQRGAQITAQVTDAQTDYNKAVGDAPYQTAAEGIDSLLSKRAELIESKKKENEIQKTFDITKAYGGVEKLKQAWSALAAGVTGKNPIRELNASLSRTDYLTETLSGNQKEIFQSLQGSADIEDLRAAGLDRLAVKKQREIEMAKEIAAIQEKMKGPAGAEVEIIKKRYDSMDKGEERIVNFSKQQAQTELQIAQIRGTSDSRALQSAMMKVQLAKQAYDYEVDEVKKAQALVKYQEASNDLQKAASASYIGNVGTFISGLSQGTQGSMYDELSGTDSTKERRRIRAGAQHEDVSNQLVENQIEMQQPGADVNKLLQKRMELENQLLAIGKEEFLAEREDVYQQQLAVDALHEQTAELELQARGAGKIAEIEKLRYDYAVKINAAKREGNTDEAKALEEQEQVAIRNNSLEAFRNPAAAMRGFRAARRAERRHERLIDRYNKSGGLLNAHRDLSGRVISGTDPLTGETRAPDAFTQHFQPNYKAATDKAENAQSIQEIITAIAAVVTAVNNGGTQ